MADITQTIPLVDEYSVTPTRNNPSTFFEDRETRLDEETTRIPQQNTQATALNTFASQANSLKSEVNTLRNTAVTKAAESLNSATSASSSATTASSAKTAIEQYVIPSTATYSKEAIDMKAGASLPYSGYTKVSKKLDNFVFKTSTSFLNKVADKNRYVKFGDKVVDTYGEELITNGDFSDGTTGWTNFSGQSTFLGKLIMPEGATANRVFSADSILESGKTYVLTFYCESKNTTSCEFSVENGSIIINTNNIKIGYNRVVFTSSAYGRLRLYSFNIFGGSFIVDNISVREIQTAQFTVPEVAEVITTGSNTTSVAVNAGDYVVDGSELVTNGTFDTDTSGWTATSATLSIEDGRLKITNNGAVYGFAVQSRSDFIVGETYIIKVDVQQGNATGSIRLCVGTTSSLPNTSGHDIVYKTYIDTVETSYSVLFTATQTTLYYGVFNTNYTDDFNYVDNISIKRVSDTFRAKQNAPIGTALTDTNYFEDRTSYGVISQVLMAHKYNTTTNSYEGLHTEVLFNDVSKEQLLDNSTWMSNNGFSKVSEFLYSKDDSLYLPVGVVQC